MQSLIDNDIGPGSNVYAELGSSWRFLMREPTQVAQAFRTFQISDEFQDRFGYPKLTSELRQKVFGLNALKPYGLELSDVEEMIGADRVRLAQVEYRETPNPTFRTFGPKNRCEFLNLQSWGG